MNVAFTVFGNPDDRNGNPLPKLKMTGKQHWTPRAKRYVAYKAQVERAFLGALSKEELEEANRNIVKYDRAIVIPKGVKAYMSIMCTWKNEAHPDAENVFGAIADALFFNDKKLTGAFDFMEKPGAYGSVEVIIKIPSK